MTMSTRARPSFTHARRARTTARASDDADDRARGGRATTRRDALRAGFHLDACRRLTRIDRSLATPWTPPTDATLGEQYARALELASDRERRRTTIGLEAEGGTLRARWRAGRNELAGVVDSGSPFLTTFRRCETSGWGCVDVRDVSFVAFESTRETYGLQVDDATSWYAATRAGVGEFNFDELVFGVADGVRGTNAAPFFGLVKYVNRERGIRPSFLQQTDISSFALDFDNQSLTLSRDSLVDPTRAGVLRTVDLRVKGAPVYHYASLCDELWINGERFQTSKPIYVAFDSGTTGMLVDRSLFDASDFQLGCRSVDMKFTDVHGQAKFCGSSLKTCTRDCLFIVKPIDVPWEGVGRDYHIVFAGLSVLRNEGSLVVDADRGLVRLGRFEV